MSDRKPWRCGILIVAMIGILAPMASAGLVAHYKLDETSGLVAVDSSGKGNNGTIDGTPTWTAGHLGGAMQFSGSSPITLPAANMAMTSTTGSVAFWMNAPTGDSAIRTMFWAGDNTTGTGFGPENEIHVHIEGTVSGIWLGGELSFFIYGGVQIHSDPTKGAAGSAPVNPKLVNDGQWHHVAAVWDATSGKLYLDGALISQASYASAGFQLTNMCLGKMVSGNRQYNGLLDDVQIYDNALTEVEVQAAMKGTQTGIASSPEPADKATDVSRDVVLQWQPGQYAASHDVYLGTAFADVNTTDRSNPKGVLVSQGLGVNAYAPLSLQFSQTYYWRVDEVNAPPSTKIFKGDVWSFTVEPYAYAVPAITATASGANSKQGAQNTVDGSGLNSDDTHGTLTTAMWLAPKSTSPTWIQFAFDRAYKLDQLWVWNHNSDFEKTLGFGIKDATIEYSTNGTDWTTLGDYQFAQATGSSSYAHNTTIDLAGIVAKQVKITVKSGWGMTGQYGLSEVRFFYVPVWPREPEPAAGATDIGLDATLSWRAGREAVSHNVYLSTDSDAVANGTAPAIPLATNSYVPSALSLATTYYWKVEEVNQAETPSVWPGDVWSFSTADFVVVDDMESYDDATGTTVFDVWIDGYGTTTNGAQVGHNSTPYAEKSIIHSGKQSMPFLYNNTATGNSEATRTFDPAQDWTVGGVQTLVLFFRGDPANTTGQLFVKINGTKVNYPGSAAGEASIVWKQWNIDLTTIGGVKAVRTLTIGVSGTGAGTLYIDDIRLYKSAPAMITPTDPGTAGMVAYYPMEGDARDSVGGSLGVLNNVTFAASGPGLGKAAQFNGTTAFVDLGDSFGSLISTLGSSTFAAWVNYTGAGNVWQRVLDCGNGGTTPTIYLFLTTRNASSCPRFAYTTTSTAGEVTATAPTAMALGWHHLAGVVDASTMKIALYVDGNLAQGDVATTILPKDLGKTTQNWLGRSQWSSDPYFNGAIDEVRVFNRALSASEISFLAGDR